MSTDDKKPSSDASWRDKLTSEQYRVCRERGTEAPFSGEYWDHWAAGVYHCRGCGEQLFASTTKFDASCGWPSFSQPLDGDRVAERADHSAGMVRTEVSCKRCGCHLGHVFTDGPAEDGGLRYCINSASIKHRGDS